MQNVHLLSDWWCDTLDRIKGAEAMRKYTDAKKEGNRKWDTANLDRISIAIPKGRKELIKQAADQESQSVNKFILGLIDAELERRGLGSGKSEDFDSK